MYGTLASFRPTLRACVMLMSELRALKPQLEASRNSLAFPALPLAHTSRCQARLTISRPKQHEYPLPLRCQIKRRNGVRIVELLRIATDRDRR
jgi:hypothetical protein